MTKQNWQWLKSQPEGQFFERKSCYDYSGQHPKRRKAKEVAYDVAETLSAMANADGGTLALGIEDDGSPTGVDYPQDRLRVILNAPRNLIRPPLKARYLWAELDGHKILVFEVDWSPEVHQLADGRYLLRIGDKNVPFPASDIAAMKEGKKRRVTESRLVPEASLEALEPALFDELREKTGLHLSNEELLQRYRLVEIRDGRYILTLAALLLFARDPIRWHPACYVDFVKWEGTERQFGPSLNVIKRERIEAPLPKLIEQTFNTIWPHIRERQKLVDLFFEERFEYPTFAWQEAIINAVAHRDYALEGTPIEVWLFDDRMEVRSPGELVEPVTIERLIRRERIHASRNPRIVRVLTDWGYMRELGEGIPRMIEAMEREGLNPPEFKVEAGAIFAVTLRNTPVYPPETLRWLKQFEGYDLNPNQKRLLAYAHAHGGRFTSRAYQKLVDVDLYTASRDIKDLIRKGIVRLTKKGGRIYQVVSQVEKEKVAVPDELQKCIARLQKDEPLTNKLVREVLGVSRVTATRLLSEWEKMGFLERHGKGRWTTYSVKPDLYESLSSPYESLSQRTDHSESDS